MTYFIDRLNGVIVGAYMSQQRPDMTEVLDESDPELAAYLKPAGPTAQEKAMAAVAALLGNSDPNMHGVVSLFRLCFTMINNLRVGAGAARIMEDDIIRMSVSVFLGAEPLAVLNQFETTASNPTL